MWYRVAYRLNPSLGHHPCARYCGSFRQWLGI
nr:MAG TPA_asm: hypothetical protein [Caudoviricetes sp.]